MPPLKKVIPKTPSHWVRSARDHGMLQTTLYEIESPKSGSETPYDQFLAFRAIWSALGSADRFDRYVKAENLASKESLAKATQGVEGDPEWIPYAASLLAFYYSKTSTRKMLKAWAARRHKDEGQISDIVPKPRLESGTFALVRDYQIETLYAGVDFIDALSQPSQVNSQDSAIHAPDVQMTDTEQDCEVGWIDEEASDAEMCGYPASQSDFQLLAAEAKHSPPVED